MKGLLLLAPGVSLAASLSPDPSDTIPPSAWAADNAIIPDYSVPAAAAQPSPLLAAHVYNSTTKIDHASFSANANDTSVILVDGTDFNASSIDVLKYGYSSSPQSAAFYGLNAAINAANGSRASFDHINVTVHNGASNIYSYGTGTLVRIQNAWLYSSGPVSHGLHASGNATVIARNVKHFSGGVHSPSFAGGLPSGSLYVYNGVSHTQGIGSAAFYALGTVYAENVISTSEKAPVVIADGPQSATLINSDGTAGRLGGVAFFSSRERQPGASLSLVDSTITTIGAAVPGLWFGNTIASVTIQNSQIKTDSGVLVVANSSRIAPELDRYTSSASNSTVLPAEVYATILDSTLTGNLVAYNGSSISWALTKYSLWTGSAYSGFGAASFNISLDSTSTWILTRNSTVQHLIAEDESLSNIKSNGYTLHYDASARANSWLGGKTVGLAGGGVAQPVAV